MNALMNSQKAPKAGSDWWTKRRKWEGSEYNEQFKWLAEKKLLYKT